MNSIDVFSGIFIIVSKFTLVKVVVFIIATESSCFLLNIKESNFIIWLPNIFLTSFVIFQETEDHWLCL